jgi:pimeloyl-ACP methyl ester carboxylesterase
MSANVTASHETVIVPATGLSIHVATWARPAGALPLVMLHGIWDTWKTFERAAIQLATERTVHALDLRGHGESSKPDEGYTPGDYAADVRGVLDHLGYAQLALLGFSLGSMVASNLVSTGAGPVARLILEDPPYNPGADLRGRAAWMRTLLELKRLPFEEVVEGLSELNPTRDRATNELSARALMNTADGPFRANLDRTEVVDIPGFLRGWSRPALILQADPSLGAALSDEGREALRAAMPQARVVNFPGSGHLIHAEKEDAFVEAVGAFLREG